jgi:hypothetical protein
MRGFYPSAGWVPGEPDWAARELGRKKLIARGSIKKILFEGIIGGRGGAAGMPFVPADRPFAVHGRFDR